MVMRMMNMIEIMMLEAPICNNVLQILDMTTPKPQFWRSQDQLLLQDTMENDLPEAPIWARGDPSSCMIFIYTLDNEVNRPADTPCGPQKWRNSMDCCHKSILGENECCWYWWWRRWWCWWWRWRWAWKSWCSTVRFVGMFYRVWTWLIQNLSFEGIQISVYCRTQWKVARRRLRSQREDAHNIAWSSSASMKIQSAMLQIPPANIRNEEIQ